MDQMMLLAALVFVVGLSFWWPDRSGRARAVLSSGTRFFGAGGIELPQVLTPLRLRFGLLAGFVCWVLLGMSLPAAGVGLLGVVLAIWLLTRLEAAPRRELERRLTEQLPGCLDLLASALEAGAPLRMAVKELADLLPEPSAGLLRGVLGHLDIGRSDAEAWTTLAAHPVWGAVARDLARSADSGAAVVEVLGVHATEARAVRRSQREAAARTVGVRAVLPLVCCFLPAFVLVGVVPIIAATIGSLTQPR